MYFRRIYELREDNDITQKSVAEYLGMQPNVYRRYEKGTRAIPVEAVIKLADYYRVSTDYLLGRTDDPTPPNVK
ncbi:MAG: helix-turn-helix transcriptional regulator [Oscillibacter sp.]|nr:helix-turn-helix transcriptional regulator [Oscillibacter sp.]